MKALTEKEAEEFLEKKGFKVVKRASIEDKSQLKKINLKFPWVMKVSSSQIMHKAKIGGIKLNITNLKDAEKAFSELSKIKSFESILIQEMIYGEELIIGLNKTPEFGLTLMVGKGGSKVEQEKDVSFRIIPLNKKDAEEMIKEIKFYKILEEKNINLKLLIKNIIKISELASKYPNILELDINPLIANSKEAVVVDARIILD